MLLLVLPSAAARADDLLASSFGVVSQQAAGKLARGWMPVTRWLSDRLGRRVLFRTAPDIPTFERRLTAGEYDIAYMNPYHYTVFAE